MVKIPLDKLKLDDNMNRVQENISRVLDYIQLSPLTGNVSFVENIALTTSESQISHRLSRKPVGFIVCMNNAASTVYKSSDSSSPTILINLAASAPCTVSILFF
jgi:hypothetical protein